MSEPQALSALVLAGGSGTRFWPASRRRRPKQLLALAGDESLLRQTVERLRGLVDRSAIYLSTTGELAAALSAELPELPARQVLTEPESRNTCPAIAWALAKMPTELRREPVVVLPSDHHIDRPEAFLEGVRTAARTAIEERCLVTLGIAPRHAETGYGYLELDHEYEAGRPQRVVRFVEKPDEESARRFVAGGRHLWNAGIFVFLPEVFFERLATHQPAIAEAATRLGGALSEDPEDEAALYARLPAVSIDYGLMEHLDDTRTVPVECGWNDLGSWQALEDVLPADASGNRVRGDVVTVAASENIVWCDDGVVGLLGVDGLVVVRSGDAVLVAPKSRSQEVREIVAELKRREQWNRL